MNTTRQTELDKRANMPLIELIQYDGFNVGVHAGDPPTVFCGRTWEFFRSMGPGSSLVVRVLIEPTAERDEILEQLRAVADCVTAEWPPAEYDPDSPLPF